MKIEDYEEMIKDVQPIRNPARLLTGHLSDEDDWYRQQAARALRTPVQEGPRSECQTSLFVDEETGHVGRMQINRGRSRGHEGAVEFC